jgi:hypothetical protein
VTQIREGTPNVITTLGFGRPRPRPTTRPLNLRTSSLTTPPTLGTDQDHLPAARSLRTSVTTATGYENLALQPVTVHRATPSDIKTWQTAIKLKVALRPEAENVKISGPNTAAIARTMQDLFRLQYRPAPLSFSAQPGVTCTVSEVHTFLEPYLDISM